MESEVSRSSSIGSFDAIRDKVSMTSTKGTADLSTVYSQVVVHISRDLWVGRPSNLQQSCNDFYLMVTKVWSEKKCTRVFRIIGLAKINEKRWQTCSR